MHKIKPLFLTVGMFFWAFLVAKAAEPTLSYILHENAQDAFPLVSHGKAAPIYVDSADWKGVIRAANDLGNDVGMVTGTSSKIETVDSYPSQGALLVGTIGKSKIIDQLVADKELDVSALKGHWESYVIQTIRGNLVIAGSDKRGTIYGIYDLSEKIGVSPWYFWADVPVKKSKELYVRSGRYVQDSPKVKYRGIFINDESPSFTGWCNAKFGGVNSKMYAHMFELLLRLKANFLWPAMWGNAFNEDDPMSPVVADEYGIVMGTSHHEPMMRAQKEYTKRKQEIGPWDFVSNGTNLAQFWLEGLQRNKAYDNVITMGMRGDGDVAMGKGDDLENIQTLQHVVKSQRDIIRQVYGDEPANHPQLWAIFTEVQRYYDAGLTVPDDIILLFCDNNWGYIRRTYPAKEKNRVGGGGLYYHIDMNGGPWNDRWVNTTTIPKLREQFHLAYQSGIDKLWVVNVGDLKPKEIPIDFIMHYAWDPNAVPADKTLDYNIDWATKTFGHEHAEEIAEIVSKYPKYNLWRKAEVQVPGIFSIVNYHEGERVVKGWRDLANKAEALKSQMAPEAQDAYYQLVLYPTKASAGVAEMYIAADRNNLYARQGRVSANDYAKRVRDLFETDKQLSRYYNDSIANGKWKNMMSDNHIGYKVWSIPRENTMPSVVEVSPLPRPTMGIAVEGSEQAWPGSTQQASLPVFDGLNRQPFYIDVFNRGTGSFVFHAKADKPWIKLSSTNVKIEKEIRVLVDIDWKTVPTGKSEGMIDIRQGDSLVHVQVHAVKADIPAFKGTYFGSLTGEFSIPATMFHTNVSGKTAKWILLPDLGRDKGCMGIEPVTAPSATPETAPRLEYAVYLAEKGPASCCIGILPTQDVNPARGLRLAVSIDDGEPQVLDARKGLVDTFNEYTPANLAHSNVLKALPSLNRDIALIGVGKNRRNEIFDNMRWLDVRLEVKEAGFHTLKVFMIDPEIVLERIVVNPDNKYPSYFGAPSYQHNAK